MPARPTFEFVDADAEAPEQDNWQALLDAHQKAGDKGFKEEWARQHAVTADTAKIPKATVLYIFRDGVAYHCDECQFYKQTKCARYGQRVAIKPYGGCNVWAEWDGVSDRDAQPWTGDLTKAESGYAENKPGFTCGRCEYFVTGQSDCQKVDKDSPGDSPGKIESAGCCNAWEADPERGKLSDQQLAKE